MSDFVTQAGPLRALVERELSLLFTPEGLLTGADVPPALVEPMRYALLGGGKRLRPVLCLAACQAVCGDPAPALPAALAIEVLHNYTLVHDDLPCMDDDALRRGRPTVHAKFGYGEAVLVGDALQAAAFALVLAPPRAGTPWAGAILRMARTLAAAAGPAGVVGGQWADVAAAPPHDEARVRYVHAHKTGDLIACAANLGAIAAGAPTRVLLATEQYGRNLGLAFQLVDDLLDGDDPAKADELSILRVATRDEALARARAATDKALEAVDALEEGRCPGAPPVPGALSGAAAEALRRLEALAPRGEAPAPDAAAAPARKAACGLLRALARDQLSRTV